MSLKSSLTGFVVLSLSSHATATDSGHSRPGDLLVCPASCIQTVTVTLAAPCSYSPSTFQTSIPSYIQTHTNSGVYVNGTASESSVVPYTTIIIIMPTGLITGSASIAKHISSIHSYHNYNSTVADPVVTSSLNTSSCTLTSSYTYTHAFSINPSVTDGGGMPSEVVLSTMTTIPGSGTLSIPTVKPNGCHHDNCLRQFIRHTQVTEICATYTTTMNTATTELPNYISQCNADPTRISSACSCIATPIIPSKPVSTKPLPTKTARGVFTSLPHSTVTYDSRGLHPVQCRFRNAHHYYHNLSYLSKFLLAEQQS
ncbi:hypothetical protein IFR05_011432 [Cadophora sp. M221]|nr:hypothetical protein IFR05_011432 [Cadophora sp. M221]